MLNVLRLRKGSQMFWGRLHAFKIKQQAAYNFSAFSLDYTKPWFKSDLYISDTKSKIIHS